ncbi:MAG: S9 family peptidase [Acidobacteria bacterium]|nr:S9 family peptidase [Acidobacteriota bacterium]
MKTNRKLLLVGSALAILIGTTGLRAQEMAGEKAAAKKQAPAVKSRDGKKLLSALDILHINIVGGPRLSPDGMRVAYTVSETQMEKDKEWKSLTHVWVVPAAGPASTAHQFTRGDKSCTGAAWSPDGKKIAFLTNREKDAEQQVWAAFADGGEAWQLTTHKGGVRAFAFSPDGKKLLLTAGDQPSKEEEQKKKDKDDTILIDQDLKMAHLWLWDIEKKEAKRLTEGNYTVSDARWSPDGTQVSYTTNPTPKADDGDISDIWILNVAGGDKRKLLENPGPDSGARWSPDGKWIAFDTSDKGGGVHQTHLSVIAATGGTPRRLTNSFALDAGTPIWSLDGKTIYFSANSREAQEVFAADVSSGTVKQLTDRGSVMSVAEIGAGGRVIGVIGSPKAPGEIYRGDVTFRSFEPITDQNPWLKEYAVGESEIVRWKSKDGTEIEGVLTKPVDFDTSKKYPFLLNPHGGPTGASINSFNPTAQVMAANGYLVLQPNFRGSTGKGEAFAAANKNSWGKGDYEDCITGVDAIVARGWADKDRLGAFGWSYGGYMTFWILTQTDMFKAVSPGAGLTNIYSMYSQNDIQRYLRWFYADASPWDNHEIYWDRSPMKYVKNVKTPTMILHGQADTRVPIAQAQEFYRALVERGVPVEFVVYPRENHGFTEPRHNLDRMRRYVSFFGKYLKNPSVTEPAD